MITEYIIFTDLDGTLLDHHTYSFESALPALNLLHECRIPIILVSSKTRAEMLIYQKELGIEKYPFVVENGSAIYTQPEYFPSLGHYKTTGDHHWGYHLGRSYEDLVNILGEISGKYGYYIHGFHNTSETEIIRRTRLTLEQVRQAKKREFSVPIFYDQEAEKILKEEVDRYDLRLLFGGRFMHLLGRVDKGEALTMIMNGFRLKYPGHTFLSVALGDSLNDFAMLNAADIPVLVRKFDGTYEARETLPDVILSPGIGPSGWNTSVAEILKNGGDRE